MLITLITPQTAENWLSFGSVIERFGDLVLSSVSNLLLSFSTNMDR